MALTIGTRLGPYEIRGVLGEGGMGEVYRAHDPRLGRDVALKVLPHFMARDAEGLARFTREARALAALNHPHIVTIFSTEELEGVRFLTMELVEGRTLDQMIPSGGLSMAKFFDIATALADALAAAHQRQITHRDLKPGNVMVADDGRVKVLDFGLSRADDAVLENLEEDATRLKLTQAGTILGTRPYMSPEQIEARPLDGRSDLFSLGIVLYEMATGTRPFHGDTSASLMSSIMKDHPRAIGELRPDVPEGVARIITRCLEKNPRDRIQSGHEILIEFRAERRAWESGTSAGRQRTTPASAAAVRSRRDSDLRVAVLPFVSRTAGVDAEAMADGLTDDITAGLARFPYLRVVSRPDAAAAKGRTADARSAALVGARYLLDGTIRTAGGSARTSVRLIDGETGAHLWAETYDRTLASGVFELQDDLTSRVVATVAASDGLLVRSMASVLRERPVDELTLDEIVLRYFGFTQNFRADEHRRLRAGFERALEANPYHALAWGCLADLYELEHIWDLNLQPDSQARARAAADRSIDIDPASQFGWRQIAVRHHAERDLQGLRMAAERTISINPLSTLASFVAMLLAYAGDWDRAMPLIVRAMDLNRQHSGWYHFPVFADHFRKGELEEALTHAKASNLPHLPWTSISIAPAAGLLGRTSDAIAAIDNLRRNHPAFLDAVRTRAIWAFAIWDDELVDRLIEGFEKAVALAGSDAHPSGSRTVTTTPRSGAASGSGTMDKASQLVAADARRSSSERTASIAVLPFTDLSAARDQEWFCDGIAEEILTTLSHLKGLTVAARASAFSFRGRGDDLAAIGEKLHVATVLDGSVRRAGDRLRITVRLSDVANGYQIWSERYDRDVKDVFDVQDEIAGAIAERLRVDLAGNSAPRVVRHTDNQEAYHLYLRGRHLWYSRSKGSLLRARQLFEDASQKDPNYALPYVGLADLFSIQALYGFEREEIAEPRVRAALARALAINDQVAEAHRGVGFSHLFFGWDLKAAARAFERSVELDSTSGLTHIWLAWPVWANREAASSAAIRQAQALDPLNPYIHSLAGAIYDCYDRSEEGVKAFERAFELDPNYLVTLYLAGGVYSRLGRHEDALRVFARSVELTDRAPFYVSYEAWALARAGRINEAKASLAELESRATSEYVQPLQLAIVHAALGEMDRAFERLEEGVRRRNGWIGTPQMPMFADFRRDPRFAAHLRRIGNPDALSFGGGGA